MSAGGAAESSAEGEERPAVQDGGGPGGPERADEETQSCCFTGLLHLCVRATHTLHKDKPCTDNYKPDNHDFQIIPQLLSHFM